VRIVGWIFPDPIEQIVQGWQPFTELAPAGPSVQWEAANTFQVENVETMKGDPLPRPPVNWLPYSAVPNKIGFVPFAYQGGAVGLLPFGPPPAPKWFIAPELAFQGSALPMGATGNWDPMDDSMLAGYQEVPMSWMLNPASFETLTTDNPRPEITRSGLLKTLPDVELPLEFGQAFYQNQQTYQVFRLTGTTVNGTGTPIPNCRVIVYQSGWRMVSDMPVIIAETISDGSGNFSFLLRNIDYQLTAYIEGSPDRAGITRQDVTPVVSTTIYLRDPTAPDTPSGGGGTRSYAFA
jgi:hypothetical protein